MSCGISKFFLSILVVKGTQLIFDQLKLKKKNNFKKILEIFSSDFFIHSNQQQQTSFIFDALSVKLLNEATSKVFTSSKLNRNLKLTVCFSTLFWRFSKNHGKDLQQGRNNLSKLVVGFEILSDYFR